MIEIKQAWNAFEKIPFPSGYAGAEIQNIDIVSLDTFAAGCIDSFISSNGKLNPRKLAILQECIQGIETILPFLDNSGKIYFLNLLSLSQSVVVYLQKQKWQSGF